MKKNRRSIPLSVKVPVGLAVLLGTAVLSIIAVENLQNDSGVKYGSCKVVHQKQIMGDQSPPSFLASIFRGADGLYRGVGLQKAHREWALYKINIGSDFDTKFALVDLAPNDLENIKAETYSVKASSRRQAIIGTSSSGFFAVKFNEQKVTPQNKITLCGADWPQQVQFSFLNDVTLLAHVPDGRLALFNTDFFGPLVPRGIGKHPDSLFAVQANNTLEYTNCEDFKPGKSARISSAAGRFAFSSGDSTRLAMYDVNETNFVVKSRDIEGLSGFSDFYVSRENLVLKKQSWLDRDSDWSFFSYDSRVYDEKNNFIKRPIRHVDDYAVVDERPNAEWFLQESGTIWKKAYLSKVTNSGQIKHFTFPRDKMSIESIVNDPWLVLPGDRHLIVQNKDKRVEYSVLECQ